MSQARARPVNYGPGQAGGVGAGGATPAAAGGVRPLSRQLLSLEFICRAVSADVSI